MRTLRDRILNFSIRSKIIWSYILIALVPFLLFAAIGIGIFARQSEKDISMHTNQMMSQVRTSVDVYIKSIEKISDYIIREMSEVDFNSMYTYQDIFWAQESSKIKGNLANIEATHEEIAGILLATERDLFVSPDMTRISKDSFKGEEWYRQAVENPDEMQLIGNVTGRNIVTNQSYSIDDVFSVAKAVKNQETGEIMGVLLMDIKHDIISSSIQDIKIGEKGFVFVVDAQEHVVYTPANPVIYRVETGWLSDEISPVTAKIRGEKYQIRCETSDYTGWRIVGVFSVDEIMGPVNALITILSVSLIAIFICILAISVRISRSITDPIIELGRLMNEAEAGHLSVRFTPDYNDEVSQLGETFNHMLERIDQLIQMVYREQTNKRMAELKVLQEQIKPHFLYNTLDTIIWMAREYHADDIVQLVGALTNMYRIGLSKGRDYISVEQEMVYVTNYLYIQKIRYGTKLNYKIEDDKELNNYEVPKLMLQPLVENAIYHGIKTKHGKGHMVIRSQSIDEKYMEFSVEDDGAGMPEEKVREITELLNEPNELEKHKSFGLFYVEERMRIRYGEDFEIRVESEPDKGTKITIRVPKEKGI